jgi:hypothetical protein
MILNAKLLRLDLPEPSPIGAPINVRCALTPPTVEQARISAENGWDATAVLYIPLARAPSPPPVQDGHALVRANGEDDEALFVIKQVLQRSSPVLGHIQVYLATAE